MDMGAESRISAFLLPRRAVYVVGAASTGQAIARFCLRSGDRVFLSDEDPNRGLESRTARVGGALSLSRGRHDPSFARRADLVVLSPGVPIDCDIAGCARALGKKIVTAVEFVAAETSAELIVVTGTSGKTTTLDVLRRVLEYTPEARGFFLTNRDAGIGLADTLEEPSCRAIVAELSVSELADVKSLAPGMLVVTSLEKENNHDEFETFEGYLEAKLGWIASLTHRLAVLTGHEERDRILAHFDPLGRGDWPLDFEIVPNGIGPTLALAERVRGIVNHLGLESSIPPRRILDAIKSTLLERCETIEGYAMPILNIGKCKNPNSLAWTAGAICAEPRIITARSLDGGPKAETGDIIDLNRNPLAIEEAIEFWTTHAGEGGTGTVVIDEFTRNRLFLDQDSSPKAR